MSPKKCFAGRTPEIAGVHACQHYLFGSVGNGTPCHGNCVGYRGVAAAPARKRYGAIGAVIVATVLHFQEMTRTVVGTAYWLESAYLRRFDRVNFGNRFTREGRQECLRPTPNRHHRWHPLRAVSVARSSR